MSLLQRFKQAGFLILLAFYTAFVAGPLFWVATMALRTTSEIAHNPYALPSKLHFEKFAQAWIHSNYNVYFTNSVLVVLSAVAILTLIGGMAGHCFARYRFPLRLFLFHDLQHHHLSAPDHHHFPLPDPRGVWTL